MRGSSLLLTAALALGSGCATEYPAAQETTLAVASNKEPTKRLADGTKIKTAEGKSDPCAALIKNESLKMFYAKWRAYFDTITGKATPAPQELHDPIADMCSMMISNPDTEFTITRDGQFAGHEVKPNKPDISYRVALETLHEPLDKNTNPVPKSPITTESDSSCQRLRTDEWKEWDPMMPGSSTLVQVARRELAIPCDPTETAWVAGGGCWYDEVTGEDGCGGGSEEIDRNEALALIKCVREIVHDKGLELCL